MIAIDPNYPTAYGRVELTSNWAMTLNSTLNTRLTDDGKMNLWRDGLTIWVSAYDSGGQAIQERLDHAVSALSDGAYEAAKGIVGGCGRLNYRQDSTNAEGQLVKGYYSVVHGPDAQIMCAFYFYEDAELANAKAMGASLEYIGAAALQ